MPPFSLPLQQETSSALYVLPTASISHEQTIVLRPVLTNTDSGPRSEPRQLEQRNKIVRATQVQHPVSELKAVLTPPTMPCTDTEM